VKCSFHFPDADRGPPIADPCLRASLLIQGIEQAASSGVENSDSEGT